MALEALEGARLDRIILIPVHLPPHKSGAGILPGAVRQRLLRVALAGLRGLEVDDRELLRGGVSYSIDTVSALHEEEPGDELFFLIGADSLEELPRWRSIDALALLVTFLVAGRPDAVEAGPELGRVAGLRLQPVPGTPIGISSTQVRARARAGRPLRGFVPDAVAAIIEAESLYRAAPEG
jgi:nicotinate-nucleotide adenylyltransferase